MSKPALTRQVDPLRETTQARMTSSAGSFGDACEPWPGPAPAGGDLAGRAAGWLAGGCWVSGVCYGYAGVAVEGGSGDGGGR